MSNFAFRRLNRRLVGAAAVSAGLLVPLAVFGAPALARTASDGTAAAQYQYKVTVCHRTHSKKHPYVKISISIAAWNHAHSHHAGDILLGPSPQAGSCPTTAPAAPTTHGNSGTHGNNGNNGNHGNGNNGSNGKGHGK
jgi:hypothetical protein